MLSFGGKSMGSLLALAVLSALFILTHANQKPFFTEDLTERLQKEGVFENTKKGTQLGVLSCIDPDGDQIEYSIRDVRYLDVYKDNGTVFVNGNLDKEESSNSQTGGNQPFTVSFQCSDLDPVTKDRQSTTVADVTISVRDVNDQDPVFSADPAYGFVFYVSESAPIGTKLNGSLTITDKDRAYQNVFLRNLTLVCEEENNAADCDLFEARFNQTGFGVYKVNLYTRAELDYETVTAYNLGIKAVDGQSDSHRTGSTGFQIRVTDSQDTPPRFLNPLLFFSVDEGISANTKINFQLSAQDRDRTSARAVDIKILTQNESKPAGQGGVDFFMAGPTKNESGVFTAEVIVKTVVDREQNPDRVFDRYTFYAKATELDAAGNPTNATVTELFTVNIRDRNDNPPQFSQQIYRIEIPEATDENDIITVPNLQVNDRDSLSNAKYRVQIVQQSHPGAFSIIPNTDAVGTQSFNFLVNQYRLVDYENPMYRNQTVVLVATETLTSQRLSSTATVVITLTDVNDNKPQFTEIRYDGFVKETSSPGDSILTLGDSILTLSATDLDSGINGQFEYRLSNKTTKFEVNPVTGEIRLRETVDFEENSRYVFLAYAVDKGNPQQTSQVSVFIRVIDYNEKGPVFTSTSYIGQVIDGESQFLEQIRVEAIDTTDPGANITYRLIEGNTLDRAFRMDPYTGLLTLTRVITYEMTPNRTGQFELKVEATDNADPPISQTAIILVNVIPQNKDGPVFNPTMYYKTISETEPPGTYLLTVSATDADFGTNGKITFRIGTGGRDSFIVRENGSVYISPSPTFDYDDVTTRNLTVLIIATDGGSPQRSATATMNVNVTDSNNKPPVFSHRLYTKVIDEAASLGTSLLQVSASDTDLTKRLEYSFVLGSARAFNKAGVPVTNPPGYNLEEVFAVNPQSGVISVSATGPGLNRGLAAEISFDVKVEDKNGGVDQTDTSMVNIIITGQPNTALFFNRPWTEEKPEYTILVSEATEVGMDIKTLQARDPVNGSVLTDYRKVRGDPQNYFSLSPTDPGKILLSKKLDYENPQQREYKFQVEAVQGPTGQFGPRTATASIIVQVQDANDNPPRFTRQLYDFEIFEDVPVDYEVTSITAYDIDSPSFGPVEFYMVIDQNTDHFRLEKTKTPGTVQLVVNKPLDFERRSTYTIDIIAKDNSRTDTGTSLRLESKATVKIGLIDVNDNSPTFSRASEGRSFSVPETAPVDTRLGQLLAQDGDTGLFGYIIYSLELEESSPQQVNPLTLFGITSGSGVLVTKTSLRGLSGQYKVNVVARDQGRPPKMDKITISIRVQSVEDDDGTPTWKFPEKPEDFFVNVTEHNITKLDIRITAEARTPHAGIRYSLVPYGTDYHNFRIDSDDGDIYVTEDLDREVQETYTLLVEATDTLKPEKMSRRTLLVHLVDIDDNKPSYEKSNYSGCPEDFPVTMKFTVKDKTPANTIVGQASACDPDVGENARMFYYQYVGSPICQDNLNPNLRVMENGSIESTTVLSYEEKQHYLVCVEVMDERKPNRVKRDNYDVELMNETDKIGYIEIIIQDINDNEPKFPDDHVLGVLDTIPTEKAIIRMTANDPDGPLHNRILYVILNSTYYPPDGKPPFRMRGAFAINPESGEITRNLRSYDDFAQGYFELEVGAYDFNNRRFNDTAIVTLVVYQRSQILKAVLKSSPNNGEQTALQMIADLNKDGEKDGKRFFYIKASEHRSGSTIEATMTDVCMVVVENKKADDASMGMTVLDSAPYSSTLSKYNMTDRGTCHVLKSSRDSVKWGELWWVLVVIAIFIFICTLILIATVCILYDKYKSYMTTERTYLVTN